jgi:hypothetical protein
MGVQAALQQQTHCIVEQFLGHVQIFTKDLYLLTIFAASERAFVGILRGINAPGKCIILQECRWGGRSISCHHLVKYLTYFHGRIPANEGQIVGDLESVIDDIVKDAVSHAFYVYV